MWAQRGGGCVYRGSPEIGGGGDGHVRRRGGARRENVAHVCDAGRVELQRLVERHRALHGEKKTGIEAER